MYEVKPQGAEWKINDHPIREVRALLDTGFFASISLNLGNDYWTEWRKVPTCPTCGQVKP